MYPTKQTIVRAGIGLAVFASVVAGYAAEKGGTKAKSTPAVAASKPAEPAVAASKSAVPASAPQPAKLGEEEAFQLGIEAYLYGYPLVLMDATKRVTTNVPAALPNGFAPVNQFGHVAEYPTAASKHVVRPDVDTLSSSAWLDLSKEPIVLSLPSTEDRYYVMSLLDAWSNVFASLGARTTGTKGGDYAIIGPGWNGTLPMGMKIIQAPTNTVWVIGRTLCKGPTDYKAVHAIQRDYQLTPRSKFGKPATPLPHKPSPNVDMKTPPTEQVNRMTAGAFFGALARLIKANPPVAADAPMLAKLAKLGVVPGQSFDLRKFDPDVAMALGAAPQAARQRMFPAARGLGQTVNGWSWVIRGLGSYGTNYTRRAAVALTGLGASLPQDAVSARADVDGAGAPLDGSHRYVLHFDKDQPPPASGFWSLTMYDAQDFLVGNALNRYAVSSWMPLKYNKDGSLDLFIQADDPGSDKTTNWLPAPKAPFSLTLRIYWPKPSVLDGTWKPPAVRRMD